MAASNVNVDITEGAGITTGARLVDSEYLPKVVLWGLEDSESGVGLPAHDAADSGSPLKVGGKASKAVPTAVTLADRVNGWFTLEGQLGVIATQEAGVVYSNEATNGGRISTLFAYLSAALNNSAASLVAAVSTSKINVVAVSALCSAFTSAGYITLRDNVTDVYPVGAITAVNISTPPATVPPGNVLCRGSLNTALNVFYSGQGTILIAVSFYRAP